MESPEGAGIDVRVGSIYQIEGQSTLGIDKRIMPSYICIGNYSEDGDKFIQLKPSKNYVIKTIEVFKIPNDILCLIFPRSTLMRSGVYGNVSECPPGYSGHFHIGINNLNDSNFNLQLGSRIAHVIFSQIEGDILNPYNGVWQEWKMMHEKPILGDKPK